MCFIGRTHPSPCEPLRTSCGETLEQHNAAAAAFMMVWSGGKPPLPDISELQGSFYGRGSKNKPHCKDKIFICRLGRLQIFYIFHGEKSHVYIFKVPALHQTDWLFSVRWQWDETCEVKEKKKGLGFNECSGKHLGKQTNQIYTQLETGAATTPCTLRAVLTWLIY